jgi:rare lipoprotein A
MRIRLQVLCAFAAIAAWTPPVVRAAEAPPVQAESTTRGKAGWYAAEFEGRKTANGELFTNSGLTCAHRTYPMGTRLLVTNVRNGKSVVVRVNDRGPFGSGRLLDLTRRAATELGFIRQGIAMVTMEPLSVGGE